MAIKSKPRRRKGGKGAPKAPVPKPAAKKPEPLLARPSLRRTLVVILSLLTILGGLRVWQNTARADGLRAYVADLREAEAPAVPHLTPGSDTYLETTARKFAEGNTALGTFRSATEVWEQDFKAAKENVAALTPPAELRVAHQSLVQGLDLYVGAARLYNVAVQLRASAGEQTGAARQAFENKVQVALQHAREAADRAAAVYSIGGAELAALEEEWLGVPAPTAVPGLPLGLVPSTPPPSG